MPLLRNVRFGSEADAAEGPQPAIIGRSSMISSAGFSLLNRLAAIPSAVQSYCIG